MPKSRVNNNVRIQRAGINYRTCAHLVNGSYCGAMAVEWVPMPLDIPDMPVCRIHKDEYKHIDLDRVERIWDEYSKEESS